MEGHVGGEAPGLDRRPFVGSVMAPCLASDRVSLQTLRWRISQSCFQLIPPVSHEFPSIACFSLGHGNPQPILKKQQRSVLWCQEAGLSLSHRRQAQASPLPPSHVSEIQSYLETSQGRGAFIIQVAKSKRLTTMPPCLRRHVLA